MNNDKELPFASGESTDIVVRVGNTVRRSLGVNSERTHRIYKALEEADFDLSPRFLGIDEHNREIISYIDGNNITHEEVNIDIAIESIKALRKFHDILAGTDLKEGEETVCHGDFAPWNVLCSGGQIVGIIDYDDSHPGSRLADLAYACWTFLGLGDSSLGKSTERQIEEIAILLEAYGEIDTQNFVEELLNEQRSVLEYRKGRVGQTDDLKEKDRRQSKCDEVLTQIEWTILNRPILESKFGQN